MNLHHYAVVVGVNHYPGFRPLNFARGDALAFSEWLADSDGGALPQENIKCVLDPEDDPADSTLNAHPMANEVYHWIDQFKEKMQEALRNDASLYDHSRLYLYFSGHGIASKATDTALLAANADSNTLGYHISCSVLKDYFMEAEIFNELVIFADCCRDLTRSVDPAAVPWNRVQPKGRSVVYNLGYATSYGYKAYEPQANDGGAQDEGPELDADEKRGYFTRALLDGLRGDAFENGVVSHLSLQKHLESRVPFLVRQNCPHYKQNAQFFYSTRNAPIIFKTFSPGSDPRSRFPVHVTFPTGFSGEVVVRENNLVEVDRFVVDRSPYTLRLPKGMYTLTATEGTAFNNNGAIVVTEEGRDVSL